MYIKSFPAIPQLLTFGAVMSIAKILTVLIILYFSCGEALPVSKQHELLTRLHSIFGCIIRKHFAFLKMAGLPFVILLLKTELQIEMRTNYTRVLRQKVLLENGLGRALAYRKFVVLT